MENDVKTFIKGEYNEGTQIELINDKVYLKGAFSLEVMGLAKDFYSHIRRNIIQMQQDNGQIPVKDTDCLTKLSQLGKPDYKTEVFFIEKEIKTLNPKTLKEMTAKDVNCDSAEYCEKYQIVHPDGCVEIRLTYVLSSPSMYRIYTKPYIEIIFYESISSIKKTNMVYKPFIIKILNWLLFDTKGGCPTYVRGRDDVVKSFIAYIENFNHLSSRRRNAETS